MDLVETCVSVNLGGQEEGDADAKNHFAMKINVMTRENVRGREGAKKLTENALPVEKEIPKFIKCCCHEICLNCERKLYILLLSLLCTYLEYFLVITFSKY